MHLARLLFQLGNTELRVVQNHAVTLLLTLRRDACPTQINQQRVGLWVVPQNSRHNTACNVLLPATAQPELHAIIEEVVPRVHLCDSLQVRRRQRARWCGAHTYHGARQTGRAQAPRQASHCVALSRSNLPHTIGIAGLHVVGVPPVRVEPRERRMWALMDPAHQLNSLWRFRINTVTVVATVDHEANTPDLAFSWSRLCQDRIH
mmetsp:Transcript_50315/g.116817  ORF Transcript_50315/g.116817 Transcript_50315/m.116817 type:complete len:205 (+) Transcript_50315:189-803(+)